MPGAPCYFATDITGMGDMQPWIIARAARTWGFVYVFDGEIFVEEAVPL